MVSGSCFIAYFNQLSSTEICCKNAETNKINNLQVNGKVGDSKIKRGVSSHGVHVGGAKVANNAIRKRKCHFGATHMDGLPGDPLFYFRYFNGSL